MAKKEDIFEKIKEKYIELSEEEAKMGFLYHLVVYIFVNAALVAFNLIYSPKVIWFFWPLIFWGLGLACHYIGVKYGIRKNIERKFKIIKEEIK